MRDPINRTVKFHGVFREKYIEQIEIGANSLFNLCSIIFKEVFPTLLEEKFTLVLEDERGIKTELFDTEQELLPTQRTIHIIPDPDGSILWIPYIVMAIISIGVSLLMAPKTETNATNTASGANWESVENVVGQGGAIPVLLGTRQIGSRVVSHGIDSVSYESKKEKYYYTGQRG